jgi:histidinol-phosphate aminotransferase
VTGLEFAKTLREIPVYPAASTYEFHGELTKLASNETPWEPHPAVEEAIARAIPTLNRYPDPSGTRLRKALSDRFGLPASKITLGNGSCEILLAAATAMLEPGAEIVYAWPSFSMYPHLAAMTGARAIEVPLDDDHCHDLDAMAREVTAATRIVIVCNPNNPTATALPVEQIDAWVASLPRHVAVILDEAYVEFATLQDPDSSLDLLKKHNNLVLLRTFSKVYGLCGLRVGYALGSEQFRAACDVVRQPFSVNALAQAAATEALKHQDAVATRVERIAIERVHVEMELQDRGLATADSEANFTWVDLGDHDEEAVMRGLGERGVIVRAGKDLGGPGHLRVTFGTRAENDRFLAALDATFAEVAGRTAR